MLYLIGIMAVICILIIVADSNRFVVREYEIETENIKKETIFVFITDLHNKEYGIDNCKLFQAIERINPDFVCCGGDIPTAHPGADMNIAIEFMKKLAESYVTYYANGNHEYRLRIYPEKYGNMHEEYEYALNGTGIIRLLNEKAEWKDEIVIHGLELERKYFKRFRKEELDVSVLEKLLGDVSGQDGKFHILLAHNPDYFETYAKTGVELVLSGHVHGGIARIPFLGGAVSPSFRFFPKYDGGLFKEGKSTMILSRGLGMHTIPMRFLNPAELVVVRLKTNKYSKKIHHV